MPLALEPLTLSFKILPFICCWREISVCLDLGEGHPEMSLKAQSGQKFLCGKGHEEIIEPPNIVHAIKTRELSCILLCNAICCGVTSPQHLCSSVSWVWSPFWRHICLQVVKSTMKLFGRPEIGQTTLVLHQAPAACRPAGRMFWLTQWELGGL